MNTHHSLLLATQLLAAALAGGFGPAARAQDVIIRPGDIAGSIRISPRSGPVADYFDPAIGQARIFNQNPTVVAQHVPFGPGDPCNPCQGALAGPLVLNPTDPGSATYRLSAPAAPPARPPPSPRRAERSISSMPRWTCGTRSPPMS